MVISNTVVSLVNIFLLLLLILFVVQGFRKGFLYKLLSCFSFLVIVFLGWQLAPVFSDVFKILPEGYAPYQDTPLASFFYEYTNQLLLFVIIVCVASVLLFLLKPLALMFRNVPIISTVNACFGALFGVVEMALVCFMMLFILHTPIIKNGQEVIDQTFFVHIEKAQERVFSFASSYIDDMDMMNESKLTESSISELKEFLEEHGYSDQDIKDFIQQIGK